MAVTAALLTLGIGVRAAAQQSQAPTPQSNPVEFTKVAEEAVDRVCASCHGWDVLSDRRRTTSEWDAVLNEMVAQGARASATELARIRGYFLWTYGLVQVNSAPAGELAAVLGIELRVAQAIVTYRGSNGRFNDVEDLAKVPGLARQILVAQADALQFEDAAGSGRRRMTPVQSFRLKKQVVR